MHRNLNSLIQELRNYNEIVEITTEVDPHLEIAEIHRRVIASSGPALLFTNVKGSKFPVVTNLFGTAKRVLLAFGRDSHQFIESAAKLPHEMLPPSVKKLWEHKSFFWKATKVGWKKTYTAPILECSIPGADLTKLPALTSWSEDGGPFLTLPLVHTCGGGAKPDNLGMYRIQIHNAKETGVHFQIGKGGGYHFLEAEQENRPLPTNIYLGGPPSLILAAIAPLPENVPETLLASLCAGHKLDKVPIMGHPIDLIAETEFALVGSMPPNIRKPEGPFGDHYGYYSLQHDYPVFRPQSIYHRKNAVFPATVVGKPRQEDFYLGDLLQEILSPLFPVVMPAVKDLWSYGETGYHALSAACLKERYGRESMSSVFRILGEGQLSLTKFLLATDQSMDLKNFSKVLSHILERADFSKDLYIFSELSMDTLDYSGPSVNKGSKGVLLGLGKAKRKLPREFNAPELPHWIKNVAAFCPGCLVVEIPEYKDDREVVEQVAKISDFSEWPMIVAVDNLEKATRSEAAFLWTCFTRFEPAADIYSNQIQTTRHKLSYTPPMVIDARMKPWYPDELFCDPETAETVSKRWFEYFPCKKIEMGDSDYAHL